MPPVAYRLRERYMRGEPNTIKNFVIDMINFDSGLMSGLLQLNASLLASTSSIVFQGRTNSYLKVGLLILTRPHTSCSYHELRMILQ